TEALHALIDYAFTDLAHEALQAGARVTNPASRRVLEKCGFQWTGVGLYRINAIKSSAPIDRFRLERGIWSARARVLRDRAVKGHHRDRSPDRAYRRQVESQPEPAGARPGWRGCRPPRQR
ncbi:MAG TPA: GNAT family N-acetyltransferase, partial [Pseudolabrys sp.]|nr:GNAT family N-acetyltransferase [Pseudolabrys sp.]